LLSELEFVSLLLLLDLGRELVHVYVVNVFLLLEPENVLELLLMLVLFQVVLLLVVLSLLMMVMLLVLTWWSRSVVVVRLGVVMVVWLLVQQAVLVRGQRVPASAMEVVVIPVQEIKALVLGDAGGVGMHGRGARPPLLVMLLLSLLVLEAGKPWGGGGGYAGGGGRGGARGGAPPAPPCPTAHTGPMPCRALGCLLPPVPRRGHLGRLWGVVWGMGG
jgi:hypothetical protein